MEKQKKIYCGSGKKKSDTWLQVTINPEKFSEHIQEFNGNKFIKLNINIKSEPDKYGKDIEISVDTWKPEKAATQAAYSAPKSAPTTSSNYVDDLPF